MDKLKKIFNVNKPIIGMIHLPPLPGYKKHLGMETVVRQALNELEALEKGGIDGVMVENEHDHPHQVMVGPEIIAAMTKVVEKVIKQSSAPVGLEVLLNDPKASLAIAKITGAQYIRTDYFVDRMSREEYGGEMAIDPKDLMEYRKKISASQVAIFTDIQVKFAKLLEKGKTIALSAKQAIKAGSDALIVTGDFTGAEPKLEDLKEAKLAAGNFPVLVGSGFSIANAQKLLEFTDGAIVGSALMTGEKIDRGKTRNLMAVVRKLRR